MISTVDESWRKKTESIVLKLEKDLSSKESENLAFKEELRTLKLKKKKLKSSLKEKERMISELKTKVADANAKSADHGRESEGYYNCFYSESG
jgi:chromosome segregation ATPase